MDMSFPPDNTYAVEQGDTIDTIALKLGLSAEKLWEKNKKDLEKNGRTRNILYPGKSWYGKGSKNGDKIKLLTDAEKKKDNDKKGATQANAKTTLETKESLLHIKFVDDKGNSLGNRPYYMEIPVSNNGEKNSIIKTGNLKNGELKEKVPMNIDPIKRTILKLEFIDDKNKKPSKSKYEYV